MEKKITVFKLDGSKEMFNPQKIKRVVIAAGLTEEQGQKLVDNVSLWIVSLRKTLVTSKEIRDKVYQELVKASQYAAGLFAWYEKTKEK